MEEARGGPDPNSATARTVLLILIAQVHPLFPHCGQLARLWHEHDEENQNGGHAEAKRETGVFVLVQGDDPGADPAWVKVENLKSKEKQSILNFMDELPTTIVIVIN